MSPLPRMSTILWLLSATATIGCSPEIKYVDARTEIMLRISTSSRELADRATSIRVALARHTDKLGPSPSNEWSAPSETFLPQAAIARWPIDLPLIPQSREDEASEFEIVVDALADDQVLAEARAITTFEPNAKHVLELSIMTCPAVGSVCSEADCHGEQCKTCISDGTCQSVGVLDPTTLPTLYGGQNTAPIDSGVVAAQDADSTTSNSKLDAEVMATSLSHDATVALNPDAGVDEQGPQMNGDSGAGIPEPFDGSASESGASGVTPDASGGPNEAGPTACGAEAEACVPSRPRGEIMQLAAGGAYTCVRYAYGDIWCWGLVDNRPEATSTATRTPMSVPGAMAVEIAGGNGQVCFRREDTSVACWGNGNYGGLGNGSTMSSDAPMDVPGVSATAVYGCFWDMCAQLSDGSIACWGMNSGKELGGSEQENHPVLLDGLSGVMEIVAGGAYACARIVGGSVKCWGTLAELNSWNLADLTDVIGIAGGYAYACAVRLDGTVSCWGNNLYGQVGSAPTNNQGTPTVVADLRDVSRVVAGETHTCALLKSGAVKCWGRNNVGQLGNGSTDDSAIPVAVAGLEDAVALSAGFSHVCALRANGTAKCWGRNNFGQLGDGTIIDRSSPVQVNGLP